MGEHKVRSIQKGQELHEFLNALLEDIKALEIMIRDGMIESDVQRIGAEQELSFVDNKLLPAPFVMEVLAKLNDPHFDTELAKFNAEINLDPLLFKGSCLSEMEKQIDKDLLKIREVVTQLGGEIILSGILPTIRKKDLVKENLSPVGRYFLLNKTLADLRGEPYEFRIQGTDQLITKHDSSIFESCNNSFQVHLQVSAEDFTKTYNWAQAISAPVLSAAVNSPLLLGKRLWNETRIALFEQSLDIRSPSYETMEKHPRVFFGSNWVKNSVTDIFKEDIARHRVILQSEMVDNSLEMIKQGKIPRLSALSIHNGTIYRWNRACYGITKGKPHLRIENRYIPSGPSVSDEVANAAFWLGLMKALPKKYENLSQTVDFDDVKSNFINAARLGLNAQIKWMDGKKITAKDLILNELLPLAHEGLKKVNIDKKDGEKYLNIIQERVKSELTGSRWQLDSYNNFKNQELEKEATIAITGAMIKNQKSGTPVHLWAPAQINEAGSWANRYHEISQVMSTDLFTVREDDIIDLAATIMDWKNIRHIPVENDQGKLTGLITSGMFIRFLHEAYEKEQKTIPVKELMIKQPLCIAPETLITDAIKIMLKNKVGCLPVVKDEKLLGIVTESDFVKISNALLEEIDATR